MGRSGGWRQEQKKEGKTEIEDNERKRGQDGRGESNNKNEWSYDTGKEEWKGERTDRKKKEDIMKRYITATRI